MSPLPSRQFTLDSAYAHALLCAPPSRPQDEPPEPFPAATRCINPHFAAPADRRPRR